MVKENCSALHAHEVSLCTIHGLSNSEANIRHQKYGANVIEEAKKNSVIIMFFKQFKDLMVVILIASTLVSAFMGETTEAITMILVITLNAIFGLVQEYRTEKAIEAIKKLASPTSKVIREGIVSQIESSKIVVGDVIVLDAGDKVPADAMLIEANQLQIDESLLTGESIHVDKCVFVKGKQKQSTKNNVYMGTIVLRGRGKALITSIGINTEMGKIAGMLKNIKEEQSPLQKKLAHLGKFIVLCCVVTCTIVFVTGILRGEPLMSMLLAGISLAVASVPEGLPAVVTISLAVGVQKMSKRNALIRKLPAVETLGCATVICSDKTGTLTQNKMTVKKIYATEQIIDIYQKKDSNWNFCISGQQINPVNISGVSLALKIGALCNNANVPSVNLNRGLKKLLPFSKELNEAGESTEKAIIHAAYKGGISPDKLHEEYTRIKEIPFDSDRKCMSVLCKDTKNQITVFTKGALEVVLRKCNRILTSNNNVINLKPAISSGVLKINEDMAMNALRVLAVAYKDINSLDYSEEHLEDGLIFVGLIGMADPPRQEAADAVLKCNLAGIKTIMITGDHKITALVIAKELGICDNSTQVISGQEIDNMSELQLQKCVETATVYARVLPKHKLAIVKALKKIGHIVAMTGDGVNDAPAVKEADIGISMGITGTNVTKESSSMVLIDDNFATIVAAVEEGRSIYDNIRKFIRYMLTCNIGEVVTMLVGMLMGLPLPLLPIQILWVNLATDGLPAIALGLEPSEANIMMRSPRNPKENIFSNGLLKTIILRGILIGLFTLAVFISILKLSADVSLARTGAFVTLVVIQLIHAFECKSENKNIFEISIFSNMPLVFSVICSLLMVIAVIYIPWLQEIFKTQKLLFKDWLIILGFSSIGPILASLFQKPVKKKFMAKK